MASIEVSKESDVVTFKVTGDLTKTEIAATVHKYYTGFVTKHVVWDLTNGSLDQISAGEFRELALEVKRIMAGRAANGKTAYVGPADVVFGLTAMYSAYASLANIPVEYSVFRSLADAHTWLDAKSLPHSE